MLVRVRRRRTPLSSVESCAALAAAFLLTAPFPAAYAQQAPESAEPAAAGSSEPPAGSVGGMGDVNLFPKRVVIDARQRIATVGLYNRRPVQGDYDITITDKLMTPDGQLVDLASVTDPASLARAKPASSFLRWSPRKVVLMANEAQTVRVMARIPPDLPPGEYRSHFTALSVPPETGGLTIEQAVGTEKPNGIAVSIVPRFGISIPVIVRVGDTTLTTGLRNLRIVTQPGGAKAVALTLTREGTRSAFGDITVTAAGEKKPIAEVKGIGVYTEVDQREINVPIDPAANPGLYASGARLTVTYTDDDFAPGATLVRQEFTVP